ncbi:MAG: Ribosomal protein [Ramlibacter sp.]|nr:Ribosomal protein [Ramlibacter sp.]
MVVIRLSRGGAKARPFYNIVVADKRLNDGAAKAAPAAAAA